MLSLVSQNPSKPDMDSKLNCSNSSAVAAMNGILLDSLANKGFDFIGIYIGLSVIL